MTLTKLNYNSMSEIKKRKIRVSRVNESVTNPDGTVTETKGNVYGILNFDMVEPFNNNMKGENNGN